MIVTYMHARPGPTLATQIRTLVARVFRPTPESAHVQTGLSPLHNAVLLDLESSAQKLAFRGANVNATDKVNPVSPHDSEAAEVGWDAGRQGQPTERV